MFYSKEAFNELKKIVDEKRKTEHFCKGVSPWFWSKIGNFMNLSMLCKINPEKVFGDVLVRKQAFLNNINMDLRGRQKWHFCKGDSP